MQTFTSRNTSINIKKLPRVFNCLNYEAIPKGAVVYDYGAGRYTDHIRAKVEGEGLEYISYDPFWVTPEKKYESWGKLKDARRRSCDVIFICSNVLNVIDSVEQISNICEYAEIPALFDDFVFSVYEGDKSEIGKQSKPDCYQRNERIQSYLRYFPENNKPIIYKGFIASRKELIK